jgi:histidine triad (HIT) family protein
VPEGCVFCQIVAGVLPSTTVLESTTVLAIMDIDPVSPGHLLVIPKRHLADLADLTDELAGEMFSVARRLAAALRRSGVRCEGVNLFYADGEAAFQEVFHSHLHVFPRFGGDGFIINANWGSAPSRSELDDLAEAIRQAIV